MARTPKVAQQVVPPADAPAGGGERISEARPTQHYDYAIHIRTSELAVDSSRPASGPGTVSFVSTSSSLLCEQLESGSGTAIVASLDHPAFCPTCRERRPKLRPGARFAVVMFKRAAP